MVRNVGEQRRAMSRPDHLDIAQFVQNERTMMNKTRNWIISAACVTAIALSVGAAVADRDAMGGRGDGGVIYVTSQGLYYDTIVVVDPLPMHGPFQELYIGTNGPTTDAGPGDPDYVGGRWWMDTNGDGMMDPGDHYFLCPLLGPGRENP
jgi:hypothetical protein